MYSYDVIDDHTVELVCRCCDREKKVDVGPHGLERLQAGMLVQEALPDVPAPLREMFISGTCPVCYADMLGIPVADEFKYEEADDGTVDETVDGTVDDFEHSNDIPECDEGDMPF